MSNDKIPELFVSVDPGGEGGWVAWVKGEIQNYGLMNGNNSQAIYRLIRGLNKPKWEGHPVLVIEKQYMGRNSKMNVQASIKLVERRTRWQVIAELFGWDIVFLAPASWQSKIIKRIPGNTTKERSMIAARQLLGDVEITHDVADAVCIGEYWRKLKLDLLPPTKTRKRKKRDD